MQLESTANLGHVIGWGTRHVLPTGILPITSGWLRTRLKDKLEMFWPSELQGIQHFNLF